MTLLEKQEDEVKIQDNRHEILVVWMIKQYEIGRRRTRALPGSS